METIFLKMLNRSISAGWVILAVLLLRVILKKAPKGLRCCLWILAGIRLACPVFPESPLSLIPSAEPVPREILYDTTPAIDSGIEAVDSVINPILSSSLAPSPGDSVNPLQILLYIASLLWITGVLAMLLYAFFSCLRLHRQVAASIRLRDRLWLCDNIRSPFIFGIFFPRIYLPSNLEETQLSCIIAHEKAHLKRHDHWWKPLGFLLLSVYWFNPLCWAAYILLCRDIELACDERVIKSMENQEKKSYAETLLSCGIPRRMISACPLAFGEIGVKERIRTVLNYKKPSFWIGAVAIAACAAAAICLLTSPASATDSIFGVKYRVAEVLYDAPQYDFTYTAENAPEYLFTAERELLEREPDSSLAGNAWTVAGGFGTVDYSREQLYSLFAQNAGGTSSLSDSALRRLDRVENIWRADTHDENSRFYLAMETKDGDILLAVGYGRDETSHIRWLWQMESSAPEFSQEYLAEQIASMCGSEVSIFSIYESDTIPGKLLAAFQRESDHNDGFAVFNCKDSTDSYGCTIKGYHSFAGSDPLHSYTIGENWGFDHSITIVLNRIGNCSKVTVRSDDTLKETVPGSVVPSMVVFEWQELLSPEEAEHVEIFYTTGDTTDDTAQDSADRIQPEETDSTITDSKNTDTAQTDFVPDSALDNAISAAILEYCSAVPSHGSQPYFLFGCESHQIMAHWYTQHTQASAAPGSLPYLTGGSGMEQDHTVCVMAMYQTYRLSPEGEIEEISTQYFPAMLTFGIPGDEDYEPGKTPITRGDSYILKDFWTPEESYTEEDQESYEMQLKGKFSADIADEAIRALTSQSDMENFRQACYAQAKEYWAGAIY